MPEKKPSKLKMKCKPDSVTIRRGKSYIHVSLQEAYNLGRLLEVWAKRNGVSTVTPLTVQ